MKKCVLKDKFDVTFTRDELLSVLRLVRREKQDVGDSLRQANARAEENFANPKSRDFVSNSWQSRMNRLESIENKVVLSYNFSGVEYVEEDELEDGDFVAELPDENGEWADD